MPNAKSRRASNALPPVLDLRDPYHHTVPNESIQNLIFAAVTSDDDEAMSIERIDDALAKGADFTSDDVALLTAAVWQRRPAVLRHLFARGATLAEERRYQLAHDPLSPHVDSAMHEAAKTDFVEGLEIMFELDPAPLDAAAWFGTLNDTPLSAAARKGNLDCCRVLLSRGVNVNAYNADQAADSALAEAIFEGHLAIVEFLLAHGASIHAPGWMRLTPLYHAEDLANTSADHGEIARLLRTIAERADNHL